MVKKYIFNKKCIPVILVTFMCLIYCVAMHTKMPNGVFLVITFTIITCVASRIKIKHELINDLIMLVSTTTIGTFVSHSLNVYEHESFISLYDRSLVVVFIVQGIRSIIIEVFVISFLFVLLRGFHVKRTIASIIAPLPVILLSLADYYVYSFRGSELTPFDFSGASTAFSVMGSYHFDVLNPLILIVCPLVILGLLSLRLRTVPASYMLKKSIITTISYLLTSILLFAGLIAVNNNNYKILNNNLFDDGPTFTSGYITTFAMNLKNLSLKEPESYDVDNYNGVLDSTNDTIENPPNIIVIMNESYADMSIYSDQFQLSEDPTPFWHSLINSPNTISGYAYSSVYGGKTPNSEFEFLTGTSMAGFSEGVIPFSMYMKDRETYSLVKYLSDFNYSTTALHPYYDTGWSRNIVYPNLGFDNMYFLDDFITDPTTDFSRGYMTDLCAYENLLEYVDHNNSSSPSFYFMVTIQNHGGYTEESEIFSTKNYVSGVDYAGEMNVYLTTVNQSDSALEMLINNLSSRNEKYVVLLFGDHQPSVHEFSAGDKKWVVPYVIWANFDIPEGVAQKDANTSLNYLALDLLNVAGINYSPYFEIINETRETLPIINASGYYSNVSSSWQTYDDIDERPDEKAVLDYYLGLQYYILTENYHIK